MSLLLLKACFTSKQFICCEHFRTKRFLVKHWGEINKRKTTKVRKSESDHLILKSSNSHPMKNPQQSRFPILGGVHGAALSLLGGVAAAWTSQPPIEILLGWYLTPPPGFLEEKSRPPHTSTPPGSICQAFTSPPPPLAIRKLKGGGTSILVPKNKSCCTEEVNPRNIRLLSCPVAIQTKNWTNIGLTCPET